MNNEIEIGLNEELKFKCTKDIDKELRFKCIADINDANNCSICAFINTSICARLVCDADRRKDNTDVHFELINK